MIKDYFKSFILQIQFLTRIPVPVAIDFNGRAYARGVIFAPAVGLLIGAVAAGVYMLFGFLEKRTLAILAALVAEIALTGGLHLDGLADTCDGLFSNRDTETILSIMKDSRLGTNGAVALIVVILFKFVMLISLSDKYIIGCLLAMPVLSRMTIAWIAAVTHYARKNETSVASELVGNTGPLQAAVASIIALAIVIPILKIAALPLAAAIIIFTLLAGAYVKKKIGGVTGDVIGAVIELSEIVFIMGMLILEIM